MDPFSIGIVGIVIMLILLALGVHIALALAGVGLFGCILVLGFTSAVWQSTSLVYGIVATQSFIVIPLFIFMGLMAGAGGISHELYKVLGMWVGRFRGGLGIATVFSCTAFGVCTGSSLVCAAVFAKVSAPEMRRQGYDKKIAYGICASAGSIGMLIPPSILIVIYGIMSQQSIGKLLIAGISPGIILAASFSTGICLMSWIKPAWFGVSSVSRQRITWVQRIVSLRLLWPILVLGLIVIGGMFGGIFSPTEAAAFGAVTLLFLNLASTGKDRWKILRKCLLESIIINAMVFFILFGAGMFARFLMFSGITPKALGYITAAGWSDLTFVIVIVVIYLIMGCFMDSISMLSITLPIIVPVINSMGIDPIWFAMVAVTSIEVGLITPPVGLNVYATKGVAEPDVSLEDVFSGSMPFFFMMLATLVLMIIFPSLITILPSLMIGR